MKNFIYVSGKYYVTPVILVLLTFFTINVNAIVVAPLNFEGSTNHNSNYTERFLVANYTGDISFVVNSPFDIEFLDNTTTDGTWIDFVVYVPENFKSGDYNSVVYVEEDGVVKHKINIMITVNPTTGFEVYGENKTVKIGEIGFFLFDIKNTGNTYINLTTSQTGNISLFLSDNLNINIPPGTTVSLPVSYVIPDLEPDIYEVNLTFFSGVNKTINLELNVTDDELPTITDYDVPKEVKAFTKFTIEADVEDNVGVETVVFSITNNEEYNDSFVMKGDGKYKLDLELPLGKYFYKIRATDTSGNKADEKDSIEVVKVGDIFVQDFNYYQIVKGATTVITVFESERDVPVNITIEEFNFDKLAGYNKTDVEFFIDVDNKRKDIDFENENDSFFEFDDVNIIKVGISSEVPGYYNGVIKLNLPSWVDEDKKVNIDGRVGDMEIRGNYTTTVGNVAMNCIPEIAEEPEKSYWECTRKYPIGIDITSFTHALTEEQYNVISGACDREKDTLQNTIDGIRLEKDFLYVIIILIIIVLVIYYLIKVRNIKFAFGGV